MPHFTSLFHASAHKAISNLAISPHKDRYQIAKNGQKWLTACSLKDILATMERPPDQPPSRSADYCTKKSFFQVNIARGCFFAHIEYIYHFQNFTRKPSFKQLVRSSSDGTDTTAAPNGSSPHSKSPSHKTSPSHSNQGNCDDEIYNDIGFSVLQFFNISCGQMTKLNGIRLG